MPVPSAFVAESSATVAVAWPCTTAQVPDEAVIEAAGTDSEKLSPAAAAGGSKASAVRHEVELTT